jgi:hypothetical protein
MAEVIADLEQWRSHYGPAFDSPPSVASQGDAGLTNFLNEIAVQGPQSVMAKKPAPSRDWARNTKLLTIGSSVLGAVVLLAVLVISLRTKVPVAKDPVTKDIAVESNGTKSIGVTRVPMKPAVAAETVAAKDVKETDAAPNHFTLSADRSVAEWVLSIGGAVVVNFDYGRRIKAVSELPKESFALANIWLGQNQKVTDRDLSRFKDCQGLWLLDLTGTQVTDAGLAHVKEYELSELYLSNTSITDSGLAHLKDCTKIRQIQISDTAVTDAGLSHLKRLNRMTALFLHRTKVTEAGVRQLADVLPQCTIYWDGGEIEAKRPADSE